MEIKQKASIFAVISASILAAGKFFVGLTSGSMAVTSSGLDSLLDVFMSGMNFFAIKKAAQPADEEHQYGHGKAEDIAAVIQSLVIVFSGATILYITFQKFVREEKITYSGFDTGVMILSLVFSIIISTVLKKVGQKTGSNALIADALHYTSDLYSNGAAILAIILSQYTGIAHFDLLFAVIIGFIIIFSAIKIFRNGLSGLMDTSVSRPDRKKILGIIDTMPFPYAGYHKLRSRLSGSKKYLDFHLLICRKAHIDEAHDLADKVEIRMTKEVRNIDVIIHIEPCPNECDLTDETCIVLKIRGIRRDNAFFNSTHL